MVEAGPGSGCRRRWEEGGGRGGERAALDRRRHRRLVKAGPFPGRVLEAMWCRRGHVDEGAMRPSSVVSTVNAAEGGGDLSRRVLGQEAMSMMVAA